MAGAASPDFGLLVELQAEFEKSGFSQRLTGRFATTMTDRERTMKQLLAPHAGIMHRELLQLIARGAMPQRTFDSQHRRPPRHGLRPLLPEPDATLIEGRTREHRDPPVREPLRVIQMDLRAQAHAIVDAVELLTPAHDHNLRIAHQHPRTVQGQRCSSRNDA